MATERRARYTTGVVAWVVGSSLIWAAVIVDTGDVGWPLVVWALTTFAPLARRHGPSAENG
jgi:hypothetical protein